MAFNLFSSLGNLISGGVNKAADYLAGKLKEMKDDEGLILLKKVMESMRD